MAKLQQFLDLLDRPGVREVVLQSNSQPAVRLDDGLRPVARQFLSTAHVHAIVRGTSLERLLPKADEPRQTATFEHGGRLYAVKTARFGERVQVRIARSAVRQRAASPQANARPPGPAQPTPPTSTSDTSGSASFEVGSLPLPPGAAPASTSAISNGSTPTSPPTSRAAKPPPAERSPGVAAAPQRDRVATVAGSPSDARRPDQERSSDLPAVLGGALEKPDGEAAASAPNTESPHPTPRVAPNLRDAKTLPHFARPLRPQRRISAAIEAIPLQLETEDDQAFPSSYTNPESETTTSTHDSDLPAVLGFGAFVQPPAPSPPTEANGENQRVATRTDSIPAAPTLIAATHPETMEEHSIEVEAPITDTSPRMQSSAPSATAVIGGDWSLAHETVGVVDPQASPLAKLVAAARKAGATDLHVFSGLPARLRVLGKLISSGDSLVHDEVKRMVLPLLSPTQLDQLEARGHVDFALDLGGLGRVRGNVCRQRAGLKGCFRLVPTRPATLEELELPTQLRNITRLRQGLVLIAGPAGHGKTTTLSALVHDFNTTRPIHIVTIEDPIEVIHGIERAVVSQREVGTHTTSFPQALRAALREDPDVIVVGELRDARTAEMVLTACQTGHLVISTINAPSAQRAIERFINLFPLAQQSAVRTVLAGALKLVAAQQLLPRIDGEGLVPAVEIVTGGIALWTLIRDDKLFQLPALLRRGRHLGMVPLSDALRLLETSGSISSTVADALRDDTPETPPRDSASRTPGRLRDLIEGKP